ncbi:hypothetical protein [Leptospira sp. 'Mane']|uniref:hypothetical protein n=1 Tax=Leptospira sp. 'Mane' TaxID=3387407 RepID=UPI00398A7A96
MELVAQVWIFPKFETIYLFYLFLIGLAAFAYIRLMNFLQSRQTHVFSYWNDFQKFALARKCNQMEMNILHSFYESLQPEEAEKYLHPENRGKLRNALYRYFLKTPSNPTEKEVNLFDKLFRSSADLKKEIESLEDIPVGEVGALEADGKEELTYVMQKTNEDLLLSTKALSKGFLVLGKIANLYVFRPSSGGYLIHGVITKLNQDGIVFHFNGTIEKKGEAHLMLLAKYSLMIAPWPPKDETKESIELDRSKLVLSEESIDHQLDMLRKISKEQHKDDESKFAIPDTAKPFTALSERISDRGLTFEIPPNISTDIWKVQDLWEVSFSFPDGPTFSFRGKMFPVKQKGELYLIRYVDADESTRKEVYEEIKKRGGSREILT